jgi:hypothetical protein
MPEAKQTGATSLEQRVHDLEQQVAQFQRDAELANMFIIQTAAHSAVLVANLLRAIQTQDAELMGSTAEEAEATRKALIAMYARTQNLAQ